MMTNDDSNSYRAAQIFSLEETYLSSPIADNIWRARSEPFEFFTSVAATHWEMVVTRLEGQAYLTVRGPETRATITLIPEDAEFFGVQFRIGARLPVLPADQLVNNGLTLPGAGRRSFWLNGSVE